MDFYSVDWFCRLWIVQEAVLAPFSICYVGREEIPLTVVLLSAVWIGHKQKRLPREVFGAGIQNACNIWGLADLHHKGFTLDSFSDFSRVVIDDDSPGWAMEVDFLFLPAKLPDFQACDPRDHIFVLAGIYSTLSQRRKIPQALRPDYTKTVGQVFRDATLYAIQETGSLDILRHVRHSSFDFEDPETGVPSWVPIWQEPWSYESEPCKMPTIFRADRGRKNVEIAPEHYDPHALSVRGTHIDTVSIVSEYVTIKDWPNAELYCHVQILDQRGLEEQWKRYR